MDTVGREESRHNYDMAPLLAKRTGQELDAFFAMLEAERDHSWTGQQIINGGFADGLIATHDAPSSKSSQRVNAEPAVEITNWRIGGRRGPYRVIWGRTVSVVYGNYSFESGKRVCRSTAIDTSPI